MARAIDLDQLLQYPLRRGSEHCDEENADPHFLNGVESVLEWAQTLPTLTPPNEPLMPDELKEMGGKPVWTVGVSYTDDGKWAMWDIVEKADDEGVDFGYSTESREWWNYNLRDKDGKLLNCAWVCYRRPPEGEA